MPRLKWRLLMHALLIGLGIPAVSEAISNTETFGGFEFNLNNPGARALGMGGAFIAVADDATAAVTNPAGLPILQRPEISAEVKFTKYTNTIQAFTNTRQEGFADVYHSRDFDDHVTTPSFFSFVYPTERFVGAVFVREQVNFESHFTTNGVFQSDNTRNFPVQSNLDITALNFGAAVGLNLAKLHPLLPNLGGSIEFSHGTVNSKLQRFGFDEFVLRNGMIEVDENVKFSQSPDFSPFNVVSQTSVDGSDTGIGFNVGALWRPLENLSIGAVFRRGPKFNMQQTFMSNPFVNFLVENGTLSPTLITFQNTQVFDFTLKVPDVYGAGIAYRLFDRLTITLDVVRIRYSQLLENMQIIFRSPGQPLSRPEQYKLDDATEVHFGAEYIFFIRRIPLAVRAGFFTDPDHKIRYTGPAADVFLHSVFPGGKDQVHVTGGVGIVPIPGLQIDFAVNQSDTVQEFVISTVYRF
jgi:long-chain fatty acid transport protein